MLRTLILVITLSCSVLSIAQNRYVATPSMGGSDTNTGSFNSPFATVNKALSMMSAGDTCFIRKGTYHEEIVVNGKSNIVIMPFMEEWVVFDGTIPIQTNWAPHAGNIYKTTLNEHIWQLFVDQKEMVMARWPNGNFSDKSIYTWDSWASGIEDSTLGFPNGSYNGFELVDSSNKDLGATGLDLTGAYGIMNVGSFKTWNREITHNAQDNFFTYDPVPNGAYRDKHHHFFVEGKLELLDQANEWFYDTTSKTLYLYPDNGQNPNGRDIKGKAQDYAFTVINSTNINLKNIYFFSTTFFTRSSSEIVIEECHFAFPNCSKRMLREFEVAPNVSTLGQSGSANEVHNSTIRKCLFEYTDGEALRIYGDSNTVENCYMQYIDYTVSELPFLMVGVYINGDANKFLNNTVHHAAASAFLAPGTTPEFAYNEVWSTGALQSDGSVYQGTSATVENSNIHHNYIHDTPKYALRFDAPGGNPGQAGQYGKMHHNIAVRTNGIMVKGNHHYICYNTTFSSNRNGLIILSEDNSNDSSYIYNNFSEKMSAHRRNQIPIPGIASNNWNGYANTAVSFWDEMDTNTYLPFSNSSLVDGGLVVPAIPRTLVKPAPDIGALEYGAIPWQSGVDWGPKFYPWTEGCTDAAYCQYNSLANIDDGSCGDGNYDNSDFSITSHTYTQSITQTAQGAIPSNKLKLPIGESLSVKTSAKGCTSLTAIAPNAFNYFDVVEFFNYDPYSSTLPTHILGTINSTAASSLGQTALPITNTNEIEFTTTPTSATAHWLTYTFKEMATGAQPLDAYGSGFVNSVNVAWYEAPALNGDGDGLIGAVPDELVTLVLDGVTYTATAGNDGTVGLSSFTDGLNTLSDDAISSLVNGLYSIDQNWTSGGSNYTHASPTRVLSVLSINAASTSVSGTAAPGATVTLTIGDETFTTIADANTGIYDFFGTTSSTALPSSGVAFNTLIPFTESVAYTINQSLTGYTSVAAVSGRILAAASEIAVPTIGSALALTNTSVAIVGAVESGAHVYLYDEDGKQLFDANGHPITTTGDVNGAYSINVDLSAAQVSTGSNLFASAYTSPYAGSLIQVGSTDTDGNTAPLSAAFVNPSVYTSNGTWTDASGTSITAPSISSAATSSSPVIRYEGNATLNSGINGLSGIEVASGATVTVPTDGCLDVAGSLAVQGSGAISLGAIMNTGGTNVESAQLKFTGKYLGPPTFKMNGQLFKYAHIIGSPMKEGFVASALGDVSKLIGWDAYSAGTYYNAGEGIATQGLGFYAVVDSGQFITQAGGFDVIGSPMSFFDMSLGYVADNYSTTSAGSGWNMIANPYTCGWDWSLSSLTNVATTFYIYDVSNSSWTFWTGTTGTGLSSGVIPPLQGIWVQTTQAGAMVSSTMDAAGELACASGSSQNGFLKTVNSIYKLTTTALGDSSDYSEMYLIDIAGASNGFDANYDAWHMNGHLSRGKLYNVVGAEEIVSNALEIDSSKVVDLAFDSDYLGTTYALNLIASNVDSTLKVVLEDRFEGTLWSMDNGAYTFVHTETPVGIKQTRFALRYYQEAANAVGEEELDKQADIAVAGTTIIVSNPEAYGEYQVYDASGRLMTKGAVIETTTLPADNWENGIYRLVFVGEQLTTISIIINK